MRSSAGRRSIMARATVRPPKPLSNIPMGRSSIGPRGYPVAAPLPSAAVFSDPVLAHGGLNAGADNVATILVVGAIVVVAWFQIVRRRARFSGQPSPKWLKLLPVLAVVLVAGAAL